MGSNQASRHYTADEKASATARSMEIGYRAVSAETGIPWGTLSCWVFKARQAASANASPVAAVPPATTTESPVSGKSESATAAAVATPPVQPAAATSPAQTSAAAAAPAPPKRSSRPRVAKVYTPSQIAQALERVAAIGVRPAAKELGISRNALRDWDRKVAKAAQGEGPSPTSGPDPKTIEERRDAAILTEWRKQQGLGPSQIRNQLRRAGITASVHTVRRVMEGAGYRPPKVERREHTGEYEAVRPGQLWHMDFLHRYIHGQKVFVLALIDDYSRFVTGWALDDAERADAVITAFEGAVLRHGRPEAVMSDGGSAFWAWKGSSRFTRLLEEYGTDQIIATTPQLNGKSEVFNANIQKELFNRITFSDVGDLRRHLGPHFAWYNHHRTHHALGGLLVPADRFYGRVEEVLARIECGQGATDLLDLATRTLDLFRVTSRQGRSEVWLMGRKIFAGPEQ
jgi:putative transposase